MASWLDTGAWCGCMLYWKHFLAVVIVFFSRTSYWIYKSWWVKWGIFKKNLFFNDAYFLDCQRTTYWYPHDLAKLSLFLLSPCHYNTPFTQIINISTETYVGSSIHVPCCPVSPPQQPSRCVYPSVTQMGDCSNVLVDCWVCCLCSRWFISLSVWLVQVHQRESL